MSEPVYKILEIVGTSPTSIEDAVQHALDRAAKTMRHMYWFQIAETRGNLENGKIKHWQVTLKVGFELEG